MHKYIEEKKVNEYKVEEKKRKSDAIIDSNFGHLLRRHNCLTTMPSTLHVNFSIRIQYIVNGKIDPRPERGFATENKLVSRQYVIFTRIPF